MYRKVYKKLLITLVPEAAPIVDEELFVKFKKRVLSRFKYKVDRYFQNDKGREVSFKELFDLPKWLPFELWLLIQLRGRGVDFFKESSLDHIVPLSWAKTVDELARLMSYKNTRLLDKDYNSRKASFVDEENKELCFYLLGRYPDQDVPKRPDQYENQRKAEDGDRFAKLLQRGKGMSSRMVSMRNTKKKYNKKGRK